MSGDSRGGTVQGAARRSTADDAAAGSPMSAGVSLSPVCIGIGGRAGIGRTTLVDALARRMVGRGPLTVGELPASNDPHAWEQRGGWPMIDGAVESGAGSASGARPPPTSSDPVQADGPDPTARAVPVDIAVHMVLGAVLPSDRRAIEAQSAYDVPILLVRARADDHAGAVSGCGLVVGSGPHPVLPIGLPPGGEPVGMDELVECLAAGVGHILAARADEHLASYRRAALEGPDRESVERYLRSDESRKLRMAGVRNWDTGGGTALEALREAARHRAVANAQTNEAERGRAMAWHRRFADRAMELGAPVSEVPDA